MTRLFVDLSSGTYFTERPVIVEVDDNQLERFCELSDNGRSRLILDAIDNGPRRWDEDQSRIVTINKRGKIV